jgi:hypothetical protein
MFTTLTPHFSTFAALAGRPACTSSSPMEDVARQNRPRAEGEPVLTDHLPPDVLALVRERVLGLEDLKVLLLLRNDASKPWTASTLAAQLELPEARTEGLLEDLRAAALLAADGNETEREFVYRPATPDLEATVARLAHLYDERPADVIRTLNDGALERLRLAASRAFPEAFVPRGKNG